MTQENKELLLKDLSARLPYKVKCEITTTSEFSNKRFAPKVKELNYLILGTASAIAKGYGGNTSIRPYLFPMSSMTEEQKMDLTKFVANGIYNENIVYDWYNKNHFDYRGLIEKGLALDATGLNIY